MGHLTGWLLLNASSKAYAWGATALIYFKIADPAKMSVGGR
jgi:hypothetical protein